jgi:ATP-dependent DNA helicase RecQ
MSDTRAATWRERSRNRCRRALLSAQTLADRLALLRSLARLNDGRVDLAAEGLRLDGMHRSHLYRFGLTCSDDGQLRILDERALPTIPPGYFQAERFDPTLRRGWEGATPDGALLRLTPHTAYSTTAQKAAARAVLTMPDGAGLLVCMPTGSGKSLIFQLDALWCREGKVGGCIVVITPTVALALDHERTLSTIPGLERSRALTGDLTGSARAALLDAFRRGEIPILLLSPELAFGGARDALLEAAAPPATKLGGLQAHLRAVVIDEAHIVESWGRSFRPDFQRLPALIGELRAADPSLRTVLLSATLPTAARDVLRGAYGALGSWLEIDAGVPRYEFDVVVEHYTRNDDRLEALDQVIDRAPRPMIVYTTLVGDADQAPDGPSERLSAEAVYERLRARGYARMALFTGALTDPVERRRIVRDWSEDRLDIVVATSAFGMGVDKADVRTIVHACLPDGPSRWYQEIGRASRDGHQGLAVCLFTCDEGAAHAPGPATRTDVDDALAQATGSWLTREKAVARWRALLDAALAGRWHEGRRRMTLDLDAVRLGLPAHATTDYNRTWNMSLVMLMQRAGLLRVVGVGGEGDDLGARWDVELAASALLDPDREDVWDRVFTVRDAEQRIARCETGRFVKVMRAPYQRCVVQTVFEQIDGAESRDVPVCGRCPACRAAGDAPPLAIVPHGLERVWPVGARGVRSDLPAGLTLVDPEDPDWGQGLPRLLQGLLGVGVEQFVVPNEIAVRAATAVACAGQRPGLILSHDDWLAPGLATCDLAWTATAVLLPSDAGVTTALLTRCREIAATRPDLPLVVVGAAAREVAGRRLDQAVSRLAPLTEAMLDVLASTRSDIEVAA